MSERKIVKLNDIVSNITEFSMFRTRDNLVRPVFLIYSTDKDRIKRAIPIEDSASMWCIIILHKVYRSTAKRTSQSGYALAYPIVENQCGIFR